MAIDSGTGGGGGVRKESERQIVETDESLGVRGWGFEKNAVYGLGRLE